MKTVSYKDRYGAIVIDTYLDYIESYEAGNVPKQMIDVTGTLVDSDKLYEIIDRADTREIIRTLEKEQKISDENERNKPWIFRIHAKSLVILLCILIVVYSFIEGYSKTALLTFFILIVFVLKSSTYGETHDYRNVIKSLKARERRYDKK
ncbi:MAG: hypothetical protein ACI4NV_09165 [Thermoguttaceae bacterium]